MDDLGISTLKTWMELDPFHRETWRYRPAAYRNPREQDAFVPLDHQNLRCRYVHPIWRSHDNVYQNRAEIGKT
ncbi:Uncharacterised protein [Vibrio cholerae]|uniref:Uncharacterized protein n=1 Tax=Vibrio cholerae TaxID=666 RepID=A0A655Z4V9_VIBCL|nr:Uncharacterised protein [Vibrio cholerae]CSC60299.1 Uncharacterised protein [Vibrio cholerae]CSD27707.1 Uncharacterised protein [Vibrio cholerae]